MLSKTELNAGMDLVIPNIQKFLIVNVTFLVNMDKISVEVHGEIVSIKWNNVLTNVFYAILLVFAKNVKLVCMYFKVHNV